MATDRARVRFTVTVPRSEGERARVALSTWAECIHESLTGRAAPGEVQALPARHPTRVRFAVLLPQLPEPQLAAASRSLELLAEVLATEPAWRAFRGRLGPDAGAPHPRGGLAS